MEFNFNKIDDLNATFTISLKKEDYAGQVDSELKKTQKQAVIKGFRPGTAPKAMIQKMYGKTILAEEINRLASKGLYDYLKENNIDIIAQPMQSEKIDSDVDIDNKEEFVFAFDLGLAPQFEFNIDSNDKLVKYKIAVDDAELEKEIETLRTRYGTMSSKETMSEKDIVYGTMTELNEEGQALEGGIAQKETSLTPELIQDENLKTALLKLKKDDTITVDIFKLFNDNETVISSTLGISKDAVADLNKEFELKITDIQERIPAELNQELFDNVLGKDVATDIDTFKAKIRENLEGYFVNESEHHLEHMISHLLNDKHEVPLPDSFLKRWLLSNKDEHYSEENIDEKYSNEAKVLKEVLIREKAAAKFDIKVEMEDIENASIGYTLSMFRNYGLQNPDFEFVKKFSDDSLKKRDYIEQMNDIALRRKVYEAIKNVISYDEKEISIEDFYKMIEEHNHTH